MDDGFNTDCRRRGPAAFSAPSAMTGRFSVRNGRFAAADWKRIVKAHLRIAAADRSQSPRSKAVVNVAMSGGRRPSARLPGWAQTSARSSAPASGHCSPARYGGDLPRGSRLRQVCSHANEPGRQRPVLWAASVLANYGTELFAIDRPAFASRQCFEMGPR